jgi:Ulp1 family protease
MDWTGMYSLPVRNPMLNPKTYVNDNVVDFWMVWITRNERDNASSILTCTSHFYDCLVNPNFGLEHVSRWMQNRKVDIFSKDFILFPICLDKHWSLIVTYFAGLLPNNDRNVKPVIVHLDSLKLHDANLISGIFDNTSTMNGQTRREIVHEKCLLLTVIH